LRSELKFRVVFRQPCQTWYDWLRGFCRAKVQNLLFTYFPIATQLQQLRTKYCFNFIVVFIISRHKFCLNVIGRLPIRGMDHITNGHSTSCFHCESIMTYLDFCIQRVGITSPRMRYIVCKMLHWFCELQEFLNFAIDVYFNVAQKMNT